MKKTSHLLIDESPLMVLPSLAARIGLNEAIVLQQIQYWTRVSGKVRNGRTWIYNSAKDWQAQFPFWSVRTVERIVASLREKGLILTANYNAAKFDKTLWYSIDYDAVSVASIPTTCRDDADNMAVSYSDNLSVPIPETTEITTETQKHTRGAARASFPATHYEAVENAFSAAYRDKTRQPHSWTLPGRSISAGRAALRDLFAAGRTPEELAALAARYVRDVADGRYRRFTVAAFCASVPDMEAGIVTGKAEKRALAAYDADWRDR